MQKTIHSKNSSLSNNYYEITDLELNASLLAFPG
jgi:hypothetical protein